MRLHDGSSHCRKTDPDRPDTSQISELWRDETNNASLLISANLGGGVFTEISVLGRDTVISLHLITRHPHMCSRISGKPFHISSNHRDHYITYVFCLDRRRMFAAVDVCNARRSRRLSSSRCFPDSHLRGCCFIVGIKVHWYPCDRSYFWKQCKGLSKVIVHTSGNHVSCDRAQNASTYSGDSELQ